jgi:translation initiation factor IF-2
MEKGRGPVAICLVDEGTLKSGDFIVAGNTYAKIRNLESTTGKPIDKALPSTPVVITGFKVLPQFGDEFEIVQNEKAARTKSQSIERQRKEDGTTQDIGSGELIRLINRSNQVTEVPVIIKADVQGSLTSVIDSIKSLDNEEVVVRLVSSGIGPVSESDAHLAHTSEATIYGFNVGLPSDIKRIVSRDKVSVRLYSIIYELIDDVKQELTKLLAPEVVEKETGKLTVKGIFKTTKSEIICGGEVSSGKLNAPSLARIYRGKEILGEVEVTNLRRGPQDTKEVFEGEMCGMNIATQQRLQIEEGDTILFFTRESVARQL